MDIQMLERAASIVFKMCQMHPEICPHEIEWTSTTTNPDKIIKYYKCNICGEQFTQTEDNPTYGRYSVYNSYNGIDFVFDDDLRYGDIDTILRANWTSNTVPIIIDTKNGILTNKYMDIIRCVIASDHRKTIIIRAKVEQITEEVIKAIHGIMEFHKSNTYPSTYPNVRIMIDFDSVSEYNRKMLDHNPLYLPEYIDAIKLCRDNYINIAMRVLYIPGELQDCLDTLDIAYNIEGFLCCITPWIKDGRRISWRELLECFNSVPVDRLHTVSFDTKNMSENIAKMNKFFEKLDKFACNVNEYKKSCIERELEALADEQG